MSVTHLQLRFHNGDAKSDDLNVIPGTYTVEGEHQFLRVSWHMHTHTETCTHTHEEEEEEEGKGGGLEERRGGRSKP